MQIITLSHFSLVLQEHVPDGDRENKVNVSCHAHGRPDPVMQWSTRPSQLSQAIISRGDRVNSLEDGTLILSPVLVLCACTLQRTWWAAMSGYTPVGASLRVHPCWSIPKCTPLLEHP